MLESLPTMIADGNHSILLASASPRRSELLALTGWYAQVRPTAVDESPLDGEDGVSMARRLAETKVRAAAQDAGGASFVLAADTVVLDGARILGKPADDADARRMLSISAGEPIGW